MTPKLEEFANDEISTIKSQESDYKMQIVWRSVFFTLYSHLFGLYGLYLVCRFEVKFWTIVWFIAIGIASNLGVTAGVHRLWSHRSYKAKWPMRLILMIFQTISFQGTIYWWALDHRVHHKYTDTNADPYSAARGIFFSHIGWFLVRKHPDVMRQGAKIDVSDLKQDSIVVFQKRWYFSVLVPLFVFFIPIIVPYLVFGESLWYAHHVNLCRLITILHFTFLINSAAHSYGYKPYNKSISPTENALVSLVTAGEGWHNYHHVFPWDYKAAELGNYTLNLSTAFIDFFAYLGLAYDLKTVSADMVKKSIIKNSKID